MAFVRIDSWNAALSLPPEGREGAPPTRRDSNGRLALPRPTAILATIALHGFLIWFVADRIAPSVGDGGGNERETLTIVDLQGAEESIAAAGQEPKLTPPVRAEKLAAEINLSLASDAPLPEWTITRLSAMAPEMPSVAVIQAAPAAANGSGQLPGGTGGSQMYDPFAGAAPLRRQSEGGAPDAPMPPAPASNRAALQIAAPALDEAALESVRRAFLQSHKRVRGTAEFIVKISTDGIVLEATSKGGSASERAREAFRRMLIGKRICHVRDPGSLPAVLALPVLRLG